MRGAENVINAHVRGAAGQESQMRAMGIHNYNVLLVPGRGGGGGGGGGRFSRRLADTTR
jgi:hypothetical protein